MMIECKRFGCAYHEGTEKFQTAGCNAEKTEWDMYGRCTTMVTIGFTKKMEILKRDAPLVVERAKVEGTEGGVEGQAFDELLENVLDTVWKFSRDDDNNRQEKKIRELFKQFVEKSGLVTSDGGDL